MNSVNGSGLGAKTGSSSPAPPARPFAYYAILTSGQSLSMGANTTSPAPQDNGVQPYNNLTIHDSLAPRASSQAYSVGTYTYTVWSTGWLWQCTTGGTSASSGSIPTFPNGPAGTTVNDGTVVWTAIRAQQGPYDWNYSSSPTYSMIPLISGGRPFTLPGPGDTFHYPQIGYGAHSPYTMTEGTANQLTALSRSVEGRDLVIVASNVGDSGQPYSVIEKGGSDNGYIAQVNELAIAKNLLGSVGVAGRIYVHGEADSSNSSYGTNMLQDWTNFNADYCAITGQTVGTIPFFYSQQNSYVGTSTAGAPSTILQWSFSNTYPNNLICTQPKYHVTYTGSNSLGIHPDNAGYQLLAEKDGQAIWLTSFRSQTWKACMATSCSKASNVITITFHVPVAPLVFDTTNVPIRHQSGTAHQNWALGLGFEGSDGSGDCTITTAPVISGNTVVITFDRPPTRVGYAAIQDGTGGNCGSILGCGGNLRDSDPFVGRSGRANPNWCLSFEYTGL